MKFHLQETIYQNMERNFSFSQNNNVCVYYEDGQIVLQDLDTENILYQQKQNIEIKNLFVHSFDGSFRVVSVSSNFIQIFDSNSIYFEKNFQEEILNCFQFQEQIYYQTQQISGILNINKLTDQQFKKGTLQYDILNQDFRITKNYIVKIKKNFIEVFDRQSLGEIKKIKQKNQIEKFACLQNDSDQLLIAVSYSTGYIEYFVDFMNNMYRNFYHWHFMPVETLEFSSDGKKLYSGGLERVFVSYDLENYGLDFLPRFSTTIEKISVSYDCQFISIQLENFETRVINAQNFTTIQKIKNLKLNTIINNIMYVNNDFFVNKLNDQEFVLFQNLQSKCVDIKIFNPAQRNYIITPEHHQKTDYKVDKIVFDSNKNFGVSYEYLKEDQEILFSKLRFFVNDQKNNQILKMGEYQDPHIFNRIIQIASIYNETKNVTTFITICTQFIKFWNIQYSEKDKQTKFSCSNVLENSFNMSKIFVFSNKQKFYIFSQLEKHSQIYELSDNFALQFIGQFNTSSVQNFSNLQDLLLIQEKNHILFLNKENFLIEHNIFFSEKFELVNINQTISLVVFKDQLLVLDNQNITGCYRSKQHILKVIPDKNNFYILEKDKIVKIGDEQKQEEEKVDWRNQIQNQINQSVKTKKFITETKQLKTNIYYDQDSQNLMPTNLYIDKIFDQVLLKSRQKYQLIFQKQYSSMF